MSQAGIIDSGSGGTVVETLTGNDGVPVTSVGNNIDVEGLLVNGAQQTWTFNDANVLRIEDRTFLTEYVVDASTTEGERGTFTTIQSAINAADAAGRATGRMCIIMVRPGLYTENLTFPANTVWGLLAFTDAGNDSTGGSVTIIGDITLGASTRLAMQNIQQSTTTITVPATAILSLNGCGVANISVTGAGDVNVDDSSIGIMNMLGGAGANIHNSIITLLGLSGVLPIIDCYESVLTGVILADSAVFRATRCDIGSITGTTSQPLQIASCSFQGTTPINPTATVNYSNIYESFAANVATSFFGSNVTPAIQAVSQGNILQVRRVAGDAVVAATDYLVAITDTSVARTVTLPSTGVLTNQAFIIKDESLNAGTNNITVSVNGGVKTIDGALSQTISSDGGAFTAYYNGTNYFIL